jgi:HTH-type transcriptional regulator / antitoxin HigA
VVDCGLADDLKERKMDINPIKTEGDYRATLREVESLMSATPDSPEGELLDVLVTLVEAYERQHFLWMAA